MTGGNAGDPYLILFTGQGISLPLKYRMEGNSQPLIIRAWRVVLYFVEESHCLFFRKNFFINSEHSSARIPLRTRVFG